MSKRKIPTQLRRKIKERAGFYCEYCLCHEAYSPAPFSIEHIIPLDAGGHDTSNNLALACQGCNNFKYNKIAAVDPVTLMDVSLFHPRKDHWHEHFTWNADATELIGLTPAGRATIEELKLNRESIVNLRRVLSLISVHPPKHRSGSK